MWNNVPGESEWESLHEHRAMRHSPSRWQLTGGMCPRMELHTAAPGLSVLTGTMQGHAVDPVHCFGSLLRRYSLLQSTLWEARSYGLYH